MGRKSRNKKFNEAYEIYFTAPLEEEIEENSDIEDEIENYDEILNKVIDFKFWCEDNLLTIMSRKDSVNIVMDHLFPLINKKDEFYYDENNYEE